MLCLCWCRLLWSSHFCLLLFLHKNIYFLSKQQQQPFAYSYKRRIKVSFLFLCQESTHLRLLYFIWNCIETRTMKNRKANRFLYTHTTHTLKSHPILFECTPLRKASICLMSLFCRTIIKREENPIQQSQFEQFSSTYWNEAINNTLKNDLFFAWKWFRNEKNCWNGKK